MKNIRALRQFSHFHAGTFNQFEEREVDDAIAEALVGMELAEIIDEPESDAPPSKTAKKPGAKEVK